MRDKKKKPKKVIRIQDLRPLKDAKGGCATGKHISVSDVHRLLNLGRSKSSRNTPSN
jgi:hypothetical protein